MARPLPGDLAANPAVPQMMVARMFYTLCMSPGCDALDDYADTPAEGRRNMVKHARWHAQQAAEAAKGGA